MYQYIIPDYTIPVLLFLSVSTSARLICARLAAYEHHRCTTFSCSEVWILRWFLSGLHTMTSLSWLAIRAAIVSLQSKAPKLDAVTKRWSTWPITPTWQPSRWTQTLRPAEVHRVPHRPSESRWGRPFDVYFFYFTSPIFCILIR